MMLTVVLLVAAIVVLAGLLARLALSVRRRESRASITEEQARKNAAPLTTAIVAPDRPRNPRR